MIEYITQFNQFSKSVSWRLENTCICSDSGLNISRLAYGTEVCCSVAELTINKHEKEILIMERSSQDPDADGDVQHQTLS